MMGDNGPAGHDEAEPGDQQEKHARHEDLLTPSIMPHPAPCLIPPESPLPCLSNAAVTYRVSEGFCNGRAIVT